MDRDKRQLIVCKEESEEANKRKDLVQDHKAINIEKKKEDIPQVKDKVIKETRQMQLYWLKLKHLEATDNADEVWLK